MNNRSRKQQQSWRYSGSQRAATRAGKGKSTVRERRVVSTLLLVVVLAAAVALVFWIATRRYQHTLVSYLSATSRTYTSEPEQPYTLPPLRFSSETIAPLQQHPSEEFRVEVPSDALQTSKRLEATLADAISQLERDDALILWIRAKGMSLAGKPYLLSGDYDLPSDASELEAPPGAVPWEVVIEEVSRWSGPTLILLDWGNQLADARAGQWENDFLPLAVREIAQAPPRVHCLVSHLPGQISLDSLADGETLFGRSCAEALVGPRRTPTDGQSRVRSDGSLLLGDLAEYVIRRVMADSGLQQTPWLVHGGSGWAAADVASWTRETDVALVKLGSGSRPLRWPAADANDADAANEGESTRGNARDSARDTENSRQAGQDSPAAPTGQTRGSSLAESLWPLGPVWQALDDWTVSEPELGGWSTGMVAPLDLKRLVTMTADLEARWFAGEDFRAGMSGNALQAEIEGLLREIRRAKTEVQAGYPESSLARALTRRPTDVPEAEFRAWQQSVRAVGLSRQLGARLTDSVQLSDSLLQLTVPTLAGGVSGFREAVKNGISSQQRFIRLYDSVLTGESASAWGRHDWQEIGEDLAVAYRRIGDELDSLVDQAASQPVENRAVTELLLRYSWLTHSQRNQLLRAQILDATMVDVDSFWPRQDLALLVPPEPTLSRSPSLADTLWPELLSAEGLERALQTEAAVVSELVSRASKLVNATRFVQDEWYTVDGRDLCQKPDGWLVNWQAPVLPPVPEPAPAWTLTWHLPDPSSIRRRDGDFQLSSSTQPGQLDLRLTRRGRAELVRTVRLRASGLQLRLRSENLQAAGDWQNEIRLSRADLLKSADLTRETWYVPIEVKGLGRAESVTPPELQVQVEAGEHSPATESVACLLPVVTPVTLEIQQLVRRNSQDIWETCDEANRIHTVRPIAGRLSRFRCLISNVDSEPRQATIHLYAIPPLGTQHPKGQLTLPQVDFARKLEEFNLSRFAKLATSPAIPLKPSEQSVVDFSANGDGDSSSDAGQPARASARSSPDDSNLDISWGLLAVVRLSSETTRQWKHWVEFIPRASSEYLDINSTSERDGKTIQVDFGLRDEDRDGHPDLAPVDFSAEKPIRIQAEIGSGMDPREATLPPMNRDLSPDKLRDQLTVMSRDRIRSEVELRLHVDGAPRAICHYVGLGGRAGRRVPPDRMWMKRIEVDEGLSYVAGYTVNRQENERELGRLGALFKSPVTKPLRVVIAADARESLSRTTSYKPVDLKLTRPGWELKLGPRTGDRDLQVRMVGEPGNSIPFRSTLSDWSFSIDVSTLRDIEAQFLGSIADSGWQPLPGGRLVLDGQPPRQIGEPAVLDVQEGQNSRLQFAVSELSEISDASVLLGPVGQPGSAQPIIEKISTNRFTRISGGWKLSPIDLPVKQRPAGEYELTVPIEDSVGNAARLGPWKLRINPKPSTSAGMERAFKGPIQGKFYFGTTKNKPPNPVRLVIKELPAKAASSDDGNFQIDGIEAGTYELVATTEHRGFTYEGTAKVVLEDPPDWKRAIEISLIRKK